MNVIKAAGLSLALIAATTPATWASEADEAAIVATLDQYETALNAVDVDAIVALYTPDGVQMAPDFPAAVGAEAIKASYVATFNAITLDLDFTVDEIRLIGDEDAVLRTHSNGTLAVNGTGQEAGPAAFKEIFLLHKVEDGSWKFTHYIFSAVAGQ